VSGTPALVSDVGAIADRVRRDGTGIVARDAGEAASVLRRLTSHPEELHSLQQRVRRFVHRSVAASAAEHRAAYRAVGFSLTPDAELRPEWLHEISERAGVAPSLEGGGTRLVESPTPRASIRRRLEPLIQKVKPFVPAPLRKVAKEALRRVEDRPVLLLDPARPASMVGLRRIGRKWRTAIFDASSPDPQLILPVKPFVPSSINELRFRLRRERDGFAFAQLFWSHGPGSGFSEDNSARIELVGKAGEWREYRLRLDSAELRPRWLGGDRIVRMRFDPINLPGRIEVGPLEFHD